MSQGMEVGQRDARVLCHPGILHHGDMRTPGCPGMLQSITPCPRNGDKGHHQQHTSHHFIVTAAKPRSQRGSGSSPSPSTAPTPTAACAPPSCILHPASCPHRAALGHRSHCALKLEVRPKVRSVPSIPVSFSIPCALNPNDSAVINCSVRDVPPPHSEVGYVSTATISALREAVTTLGHIL